MMDRDLLSRLLDKGEVVTVSKEEWLDLASELQVLDTQDTGFAGQISILRGPTGTIVMEEPSKEERVLRPMEDEDAAAKFVAERMRTYDRMWDGCGCKVDYYR